MFQLWQCIQIWQTFYVQQRSYYDVANLTIVNGDVMHNLITEPWGVKDFNHLTQTDSCANVLKLLEELKNLFNNGKIRIVDKNKYYR